MGTHFFIHYEIQCVLQPDIIVYNFNKNENISFKEFKFSISKNVM